MPTLLTLPVTPPDQQLTLYGVDWATYESLLRAFQGRHLRLNFDEGLLEIMVTGSAHERWKKLLARLLEISAEEFGVSMLGQEGSYRETDSSPTFTAIPLAGFADFLRQGDSIKHLELYRQFRTWVTRFVNKTDTSDRATP